VRVSGDSLSSRRMDDSSVHALAVKSRALGAPRCGLTLSRAGSLMEWELLASPICRLNGLVSTRCSAFLHS
jgi:hypothetical protein